MRLGQHGVEPAAFHGGIDNNLNGFALKFEIGVICHEQS